jgi:hypothetical protein
MNPYIALTLFAANFAAGSLYALFVRYTGEREAGKAATCSVAITLLMATNILQFVSNPLYLVPVLAGNWLGTYSTIRPPKFTWRPSCTIR